jgi:ATP-dependent helicase/nuclease subunit A
MDRVIVTDDAVTIVDHKTNAAIPATPAEVPAGLAAQMGAYARAAAAIWPGRRVATAILWTRGPRLMEMPADLVAAAWDAAASRAAQVDAGPDGA